ncbi:hypothetical protein RB195_012509 [Necator americanus]|uniref:R3H domain-containing protein n=1 Tax=Necator americanus TaxID=51031 RepID=A0ABR1D7G3_NECAM
MVPVVGSDAGAALHSGNEPDIAVGGGQQRADENKHFPEDSLILCDRSASAHRNSGCSCQTKEEDCASECPEEQHRNYITAQGTSSSSVPPPLSMQADSVQRGSMRRPNVSYASAAVRSNLTQRTMSAEELPSTSSINNTESKEVIAVASTSHARQKLSKQMTVDEDFFQTCSPIFIGAPDEDYLQPATNTSVQIQTSIATNKESREGNHRPSSVDVLRKCSPSSSSHERPQSVGIVITSTTVPKSWKSQVPAARSYGVQEAIVNRRKLLKSNTLTQQMPVHMPEESDCFVPVPSSNHRTTSGFGPVVRTQPISVNIPDESDELRPVRELLPERMPGVPTVVRVEKHPYAGTVPSRARQLVRSLAMCGDDDTRLRPPPPSMVNSYASVSGVGVPPRFHRNSSSLSRESSYTDYTSDLTEMELRAFIAATLHKNARDRAMILELEQLFTDFLNDFGEQSLKLPPVSSYNRMLIHRVAVLFGLDHNVDNSGKCVVVSKTSRTKPPDFVFASLIQSNIYTDNRRFCPNLVNYAEMGAGDTMQRKTQSFETGYLYPSADPDLMNPSHQWPHSNNRSFEKQHHYSYQMATMDHGTMMRKAGSFSGVPAIYRSGSGSFENFDRSQMKLAQTQSLASSTHLSPREPIDETVERFNNASLSDRASQVSYRSSGSNPPSHPQIYQQYPQVVQYPANEEMMYPPYQQQMYTQSNTMMTPSSVDIYSPQPTIEPLAPMPQASLEQHAQIIPAQTEYVQFPAQQYPAQQYPAQVINCVPQQYQPVVHPPYQTQYQQVIYPQQVVQQPMVQPQQYPTGFVQAPVHQGYQPALVQAPIHQQYMPTPQPVVHVQSPVYQQPQMRSQYPVTIPMAAPHQYVEVPKGEQQQTVSYQPVIYGQWYQTTGEQYSENVGESENVNSTDDTERTDTQVTCAPHPISVQSHMGKTVLAPLSVLVNPEPMYHYSQTSPVMSSMQQQQMLQIQCHSRPLLYKPSNQYTGQQSSVDGGYCSMTQESLRESDIVAADAQ